MISVRTRGEIKSTRSMILMAPQVPDPRIVKLAESGKPIKKGELLTAANCAVDAGAGIVKLRQRQDELLAAVPA